MSNHSRKVSVSERSRAVKNPLSLPARIGVLLLGLMLSSMALITPASAATIIVDNAGDPATGNAVKCNVANTCTLRDAIAKAAYVTGAAAGDTIVFSLPANSTITLSGSELLVDRNLIIDGSASPNLALSGNNASRVFEISAGVTTTFNQLVIKEGNDTSIEGGGGILNSGTLTLIGSTVSSNTAFGDGGGIENYGGVLALTGNTMILDNTASYGRGGGIYNWYGTLTLTDGKISHNTASSVGGGIGNAGFVLVTGSMVSDNTARVGGGGIFNSGTFALADSTISDNTAISGGGGGIANNGTLSLTNSLVSGNMATDVDGVGGGIYNSMGNLMLIDTTVSGNTAADRGGGITSYSGTLTLTGSAVSDNTATSDGGGIYGYGGTLALTRNTVSGNKTNSRGGGIFNYSGTLTLADSTVSDNASDSVGGGIASFGTLTLVHGTLAGNTAAGANDDLYVTSYFGAASAANTIIKSCAVDGSNTKAPVDNGGNLDAGNGCGFTNASSKPNATLNLGVLANNGGPTLTMMPGANSDAIGRGLPSTCASAPINSRDQRGYVRPAVGCTSGAVDPNGLANDSIFFDGFGFGGQ